MRMEYFVVSLILMVVVILAVIALLGGLPDISAIFGNVPKSGG